MNVTTRAEKIELAESIAQSMTDDYGVAGLKSMMGLQLKSLVRTRCIGYRLPPAVWIFIAKVVFSIIMSIIESNVRSVKAVDQFWKSEEWEPEDDDYFTAE